MEAENKVNGKTCIGTTFNLGCYQLKVHLYLEYLKYGVAKFTPVTAAPSDNASEVSNIVKTKLANNFAVGIFFVSDLVLNWVRVIKELKIQQDRPGQEPELPTSIKVLNLITDDELDKLRIVLADHSVSSIELGGEELGMALGSCSRDLESLKLLLESKKVDFQRMDRAIMNYVSERGYNATVIEQLFELGATLTPLEKYTQDTILSLLLKKSGGTNVSEAVRCMVRLHPSLINQQNRNGATLLVQILTQKSNAVWHFGLLLELGADPFIKDKKGKCCVDHLMKTALPFFKRVMATVSGSQIIQHWEYIFETLQNATRKEKRLAIIQNTNNQWLASFLMGTRQKESPVQTLVNSEIYDRNVLRHVFQMLGSKERMFSWKKVQPSESSERSAKRRKLT